MADRYPIPAFHFQVDWGGVRIGFTEVSGLSVQTQAIDYRDGLSPEYNVIKLPGMQEYSAITLKRGIFASDNEFYKWWDTVKLNSVERRDIMVTLLNENHEPVVVWRIKKAWPTKIDSPSLNATSNDVAIESIELVHEGLTIEIF